MAGWVAGWLDQLKIRLNSASVAVEVEVEAELGKNEMIDIHVGLDAHNPLSVHVSLGSIYGSNVSIYVFSPGCYRGGRRSNS